MINKDKIINVGIQFFADSNNDNSSNFSKKDNPENKNYYDEEVQNVSKNSFGNIAFEDFSSPDTEEVESSDDDTEINFETGEVVESSAPESPQKTFLSSIFDLLEVFAYAVSLMVVVFLFVVKFVTVDGHSMNYTLRHEDRLIVYNLFYTPEVNDVIVINLEERNELLVKRVIGIEGDTVKIDFDTWNIWVNGVLLDQPYLAGNQEIGKEPMKKDHLTDVDSDNCISFVVEKGKVFVLGDNRNHSSDSRLFGQLDKDEIMGKVVFRVYPFESIGAIK